MTTSIGPVAVERCDLTEGVVAEPAKDAFLEFILSGSSCMVPPG